MIGGAAAVDDPHPVDKYLPLADNLQLKVYFRSSPPGTKTRKTRSTTNLARFCHQLLHSDGDGPGPLDAHLDVCSARLSIRLYTSLQ